MNILLLYTQLSVLYCLCSARQMLYIFTHYSHETENETFSLFLCTWMVFMVYMFLARKRFSVVNRENQIWVVTHREMFPSGR
jgi:hypothetical protein